MKNTISFQLPLFSILFTAVFLISSIGISAGLPKELPCRNQIIRKLNLKKNLNWFGVVSQDPTVKSTYRTQLAAGRWVEIKIKDKFPEVYVLQRASGKRYSFNHKCQSTVSNLGGFLSSRLAENKGVEVNSNLIFNDANLNQILASGKKGMIYLWSPNWPNSTSEIAHYKKYADEHQLSFIPLLNPDTSIAEAKNVLLKQTDSRGIASISTEIPIQYNQAMDIELSAGNGNEPGFIIFKNGNLDLQRRPFTKDIPSFNELFSN